MTDTPTTYPPPQLVITYSGGRYHVDVAGQAEQYRTTNLKALCGMVKLWADDAKRRATP